MHREILCSLLIGVGSGIVSSIVAWLILNVVFISKVTTDDNIQYGKGKNKEFIRVYNKSCFSVYEITCRVEYKYPNNHSYFRTDQTIPYLHKKDGWYKVDLNGSDETRKFFEAGNGHILLIVTYQNRFGIKASTKPIWIKCSN